VIASAVVGLTSGCFGISALLIETSPAQPFAAADRDHKLREHDLADHTRPSVARLVETLALWLGLWLVPAIVLVVVLGWENVFSRIATLFSEMALMSVGGPYAVNSYVGIQAVETYGWLTHEEVLDGFAMAELAPGPPIQFLQFVGFLAAYHNPGSLTRQLAAALGGLLAVWVTFMPTFLCMFLIAQFIELHRESKIISATLSAITGSTLGVLLTFAIKFGLQTLFSKFTPIHAYGLDLTIPTIGSLDLWALMIAIAASIAVFQFKISIVRTLATDCAIGIAARKYF
jgi:chromate transporter